MKKIAHKYAILLIGNADSEDAGEYIIEGNFAYGLCQDPSSKGYDTCIFDTQEEAEKAAASLRRLFYDCVYLVLPIRIKEEK